MSGPKSARRAARNLVVVLSILLLVVVAERWRWFARLEGVAQPRLTWIWAPGNPNLVAARAFYAVKDFELPSASPSARLEVLGDPEYLVYLNGTRVGSGSYRADSPLDVYEVGPLLRAGANRVVIELRSAIGSGGTTLRIASPDGRTLVATGRDWSIQETTWQGARSAGEALSRSPGAEVLGDSPLGRWGMPAIGPVKPLFADLVEAQVAVGARFFRKPYRSGAWQRLRRSPRGARAIGSASEFDFGAEVEGYLRLVFDRGKGRIALVRAGAAPASAAGWTPDAIAISINGSGVWQDAVARRFRYVEVVGLRGLRWAGFQPLRAGKWRSLAFAPSSRGLFGLRVDPQRWPAVDEIWKAYVDLPRTEAPPAPLARPKAFRRGGAARNPERPRARDARRPPGKHPGRAKPAKPTAAPSR